MTSPSRQLTALRPMTNSLPRVAMEPEMYALLSTRWQTSGASNGVRGVSGGSFMSLSVALTCWSERTLRKGDWRSATERACLSVSSKTGSPVALVKSVRTTVSRLVSFGVERKRKYAAPATMAIRRSAAAASRRLRRDLESAGAACDAEVEETAAAFRLVPAE